MYSLWSAVFAGAINTDLSPSFSPPRVLYIHRRRMRSVDAQRCGASAEQSRGHFGILVIICIRPSGFRTAPRVASEKPWNAQSPAQAMSLRICLSVSLCVTPLCHHHPSTTKKKKKKTQDDDVYEHSCARINQSPQSVFVAPLLRTDGNLRHNAGGLSFEAPFPLPVSPPPPRLVLYPTPPSLFSPCLFALTKQK